MTPEGKVKAVVKALLREHGCFQHWPVPCGYGTQDLDCTGCHKGRYFSIETKAPGETLTARQQFIVGEKLAAGAAVFVIGERLVDGKYSGMEELESWLQC